MKARVLLALALTAVGWASMPTMAAGAPIRQRQTAFFWGAPTPAGEGVRSLSFSGARGYLAVGTGYAFGDGTDSFLTGAGAVLTTPDGGATWSQAGAPAADIRDVVALGPSAVLAAGCDLYRSGDAGRTFAKATIDTGPKRCLRDLATSGTTSYVLLRDGALARSADAGASFTSVAPVPGINSGTPNAAIASYGDRLVIAVRDGLVYRSVDAGGSWSQVATTPSPLRGAGFDPEGNGYAVGDGATILESTDGGATWAKRPAAGSKGNAIDGVVCAAAHTCLFSGAPEDYDASPLWSADGGGTVTAPVSSVPIESASDNGGGTLVAGGPNGQLLRSADAGRTFTTNRAPVPSGRLLPAGRTLFSLDTYSARTIGKSTDGGRTWRVLPLAIGVDEGAGPASFSSSSHGVVVAPKRLLVTADGGASFTAVPNRQASSLTSIVALDPRRLVAVSRSGVWRSGNGGRGFVAVRSRAVARMRYPVLTRTGRALVLVADRRLAISVDGGRRWRRVRMPRRLSSPSVWFVSRAVGYAGQGNRLYRTRDGGRHWRRLFTLGADYVVGLAFSDAQHGFVDVSRPFEDSPTDGSPDSGSGDLLRTDDGGRTFTPIPVRDEAPLAGVVPQGARHAVVAFVDGIAWSSTAGRGPASVSLRIRLSRKRVRRYSRVRLRGTVTPGVDSVDVQRFDGSEWTERRAGVDARGRFGLILKVDSTSTVIARVPATAASAGAATHPVRVVFRR